MDAVAESTPPLRINVDSGHHPCRAALHAPETTTPRGTQTLAARAISTDSHARHDRRGREHCRCCRGTPIACVHVNSRQHDTPPTTGDVARLQGAANPASTHNPISTHRVWTHQRPVTLHRRATPSSEVHPPPQMIGEAPCRNHPTIDTTASPPHLET